MMNLLKKLAACGLSLTMILSLAACGQKAAEEEPAEQPAQTEEPSADDNTADSLLDKYKNGGNADVDDELERMKKELGL